MRTIAISGQFRDGKRVNDRAAEFAHLPMRFGDKVSEQTRAALLEKAFRKTGRTEIYSG